MEEEDKDSVRFLETKTMAGKSEFVKRTMDSSSKCGNGLLQQDQGENPLLNEDTLVEILGYLNFETLKQYRLVNSLWNLVCTRILSPNCQSIDFLGPYNSQRCTTGKGIVDMGRLVTLLNTSWNFPCKKFSVDCDINTTPAEEQTLTSFFQLVGPFATELKIENSGKPLSQLIMGPKPQDIEYQCLKTFAMCTTEAMSLGNLDFFKTILNHAPNLRCLELRNYYDKDAKVLTAMVSLLEHVNCSKIREFSFCGGIRDEHLYRIVELGMVKLEKMEIQFTENNPRVTSESLQNFLRSQSESLERLHLEGFQMTGRIVLELPRLPKLKKLTVEVSSDPGIDPIPKMSFLNICYNRQFPVLKSLSFVGTVTKNLEEFLKNSIKPVETVEELELPTDLTNPELVSNVARSFTKLRKLKVPSYFSALSAVYQAFESLDELTLVSHGVRRFDSIDVVLTGFSDAECQEAPDSPELMNELINRNIGPEPFLNKLKVLKIMQMYEHSEEVGFTDLSCRVILLKLNALKFLKLVGTGTFSEITEPVIREMREKFRVELVKFRDDD